MPDVEVVLNEIAAEKHRIADMNLVNVLAEPKELPALPTIAARVMQLTSDPKATLPELRSLVETDEALASKILRFANSALYGRIGTIETLSNAISVLGFLTVRWLVVTTSAHTLFRKTGKHENDHKLLWEHSVRCGIGARLLAKRLSLGHGGEEGFLGGLLHDIGKLVILEKLPGYISQFCAWCEALSMEFWELENDVIGIDHSKISGHLFKKWHIPEPLSDAVANHHTPQDAKENRPMAEVLNVINQFFPLKDCGRAVLTSQELAELPLLSKNHVSEQEVDELRDKTEEAYWEIADLFGL